MSGKKRLLIEYDGNQEKFIGEIDNTTETLMQMRDGMKALGIGYAMEKKGLSFLPTTLCG
jgi:hypothetical protein